MIARRTLLMSAGAAIAALLPGQESQSPAVRPPARFERVLWCSSAERASVAAPLGMTAVQLPRGGDPAALRALGLSFYLDQPIGKGLLELRDEQWAPIQQAYERSRDHAVLVRPACFAAPGVVAEAAAAAAAEATRVQGDGLLFVALADEASATRHDAPLDTCRCEHCTAAFRVFARQRFPTIGALNQALGTQFAGFDDVVAPTTDQVRRRELGETNLPANLASFALRQQFVDEQFAAAIRTIAERVSAAVPGVPVGLTGLQVPGAFGGNDPARILPALSLAEPYAIGGTSELARSFLPPAAHRYETLFPPAKDSPEAALPLTGFLRARLTAMAFAGLAGVVVWNDANVADAAGKATPFGAALTRALAEQKDLLDACAGAVVEPGPVWLLESQASVRAWWMLDSAGDGMTWIRRLASYEREHSTSQSARLGWIRVLQDLGLQPTFVGDGDLPERLLRERPRCLVLPATIALSDRCVQAIGAFVRSGGTLLADHATALYDGDLVLRQNGALDATFGIKSRSLAWRDQLVREGRCSAREGVVPLAERGLVGTLADRRGDRETFLECATGRGRAVYLNTSLCEYPTWRLEERSIAQARELRRRVRAVLQQAGVEPPFEVRGEGLPTCLERAELRLRDGRRVLAVRVHALDAPALLARVARGGPRKVQIDLPAARNLRHLGGDSLGLAARFDLTLDPFGALFLEVVR